MTSITKMNYIFMVLLWGGQVRSARIRSGQVGKSTCQGTHVIFEITEITPPVHYTYPWMRPEKRSTVIYIVCPKLVFVFRVQAVYDRAYFALPLMDSSFRFLRTFRYYSFIKYNIILFLQLFEQTQFPTVLKVRQFTGRYFTRIIDKHFMKKDDERKNVQLILIAGTSREN